MLVLTRKPGQCIYVGDGVQITVLKVKGQQVSLGIEAPASVHILRGELHWADERQALSDPPTLERVPAARA